MILQLFAGLFATVGYALIFNQPRRHLIATGLIGGAGWILYLMAVEMGQSDAMASFFSAFLVTFLSQIAARVFKDPVMVFCIPGIMPIVPGAGMYRTMRAFVTRETALAAATGYNTITMAGAIALGLLGATSLFQIITAIRRTFFAKSESK